jgi:PAS domain S-box-containing protein
MNNKNGFFARFTTQRGRLIIWGVVGLILMSNLGAIIDSVLHPEIEYFDAEHFIVGGSTALVFGIMLLMIIMYLDRLEKRSHKISQSEQALRESENKLKAIIETSPDGIAISTLDGTVQFVTAKLVSALGYASAAELIGREMMEFVHSSYQENIRYLVNELLNGHLTGPAECLMIRKDGSHFYCEANANILRDAEKSPIGILIIERDITARKQAEEALRASEEKYRLLADHMNDTIWMMDLNLRFTYVSPSVEKIRGYTLAELRQFTFDQLLTPHSFQHAKELFAVEMSNVMADPGYSPVITIELEFYRRDGTIYTCETKISIIRDENGNPISILGQDRDITERKQVEDALRESENRFHSLYDNATIGMYRTTPEGHILLLNPAGVRMLGYDSLEEITKRNLEEDGFEPGYERIHFHERMKREGNIVGLESVWDKKDGSKVYIRESATAVKDGSGTIIYYDGTFEDITERKQIEAEIHQLNAELEQHVEERTRELRDAQEKLIRREKLAVLGQMASSVGHELRNPLTVINSSVYYLKFVQPDADDMIKKHLGIIEKEVWTSEKIIADLLDFARVKSVDREAVSISELIHQTLERFPAPASVNVSIDIPTDLPQIFVDPHQLTQVLGNITVNACQAMKDGGKLTMDCGQLTVDGISWILITVKDSGVGIPPENMGKLFEPLFTTKTKGIGLGLAVSKKLTEANGGRIEVNSEAGVGSTFTVWLPIGNN